MPTLRLTMPSTDAGESTAQPSAPIEHNHVLELKFPRCCVCSVDWYSYDADDEESKKPSSSGSSSSHHTKSQRARPSHKKLYPLPPCQCNTKLAVLSEEVYSIISVENSYLLKSPHHLLSNVNIETFNHKGICKSCLEKKIEVSEEVLTKDYQQNDVLNGQRDVKFSIPLKCDMCSQKFSKRKMNPEKLQEQGNEFIKNSGKKKTMKKDMNWFDCVGNTIKVVGWMKRLQRRANREARRSRSGEDKTTTANFWTELKRPYEECSSDECYTFSSDSDNDCDKKPAANRQIAQAGEVKEYYEQERQKYRNQLENQLHEDEEFARKLTEELGSQEAVEEGLKREREQTRADFELAKELDESEKKEANRSSNQKRKPEKQHIKSFFAKQLRTESTNPSAEAAESPNLAEGNSPREDTTSSAAAAAAAATGSQNVTCPNLLMLIEMGYQRDIAEECLADAKQDINLAVSMLLEGYKKKTEEEDNVIDLSVDDE
ncbi:hypothetical protein ACHAWO_007774 [Cyclotella atomus]|uniref:UBA domain-containing protein n=1 Tax=Cyclotella atomus TaxID=382360 RepID=A0ABD3PBD6_9STRA